MNHKSINTRQTKEPVIHAEGSKTIYTKVNKDVSYSYTPAFGRALTTLCGVRIENGFYRRWEETTEEVTCGRCRRLLK